MEWSPEAGRQEPCDPSAWPTRTQPGAASPDVLWSVSLKAGPCGMNTAPGDALCLGNGKPHYHKGISDSLCHGPTFPSSLYSNLAEANTAAQGE